MAIDRFHFSPIQQARPTFGRWSFLPPASQTIAIRVFFITLAAAVDGTRVRIVYNHAPIASQALNPQNYAINNGLSVFSVSQETVTTFVLTTSPQGPGVSYTLTASNIFDTNGNPI